MRDGMPQLVSTVPLRTGTAVRESFCIRFFCPMELLNSSACLITTHVGLIFVPSFRQYVLRLLTEQYIQVDYIDVKPEGVAER